MKICVPFALLLLFPFGESTNIIMRDSDDFSAAFYKCIESITWKKYCSYWDFTVGSCRPWRLSACDPPYIQQQLSPCPSLECEVNF